MKKIFLLIGLLVAGFALHGQGKEAYTKAMSKALTQMSTVKTIEDRQAVASQFERIAAKVDEEWLPSYYVALNYINMSYMAEGISTKDKYTTKAQEFIDKAIALEPNNAEVVALQGFNYMTQLAADPNSRGQMMSGKAMQQFSMAVRIAPENPRANMLLGQMQLGMAQFFGSPTDQPCAKVKQTIPAFEAEEANVTLEPNWGKAMAEGIIKQCGQ
ncbi:hypothetical protein [Roseivirga sp. E12]|uniref:hypothetical protein n=1 Tax=Roseivirga sp. E12 TaxID=2819237 RepID=UPI001ABD189D|nr:hypothetical protein [Roseivirga sp. E12]MBO3698831.1 hypothetical protein [Roseivirga sp. E12]